MVNADLRQKIISQKDYDEEENEIFFITLDLCIDEGNNDFQLWERYRPDHKVINWLSGVLSSFTQLSSKLYSLVFVVVI